ncbi:30S ribosomal protein S9 [candidate division WS5 bacterium]|uniref:Small ribosomal subunit protein uS9 n=1 Tax=candidate division WS5 bacterium TaxID=2093353 RepID=A0A419DAA4_9BACT|nr:MAG: 30S ribosomal protein S9 [candidate division WS5 bacterium]
MEKEIITQFKGKYESSVGRRKEAVARVRIYPGKGQLIINGKGLKEYFGNSADQESVFAPLEALGQKSKFDISVMVEGGGKSGQLGAIKHGIARALVKYDEGNKTTLKKSGYLTRDPRAKERKKPGLKRARKAPQFSKR